MTPVVLINGTAGGCIDPRDRGLQYGDGLFETIAVQDGQPRHWHRHMNRLQRGCVRLAMSEPDYEELEREAASVCAGIDRAVLKIVWTRGVAGRGYGAPSVESPTRIVASYPYPEYPPAHTEEGIRVRWCAHRLGSNPALAGIKHLNRLDQVMARSEWSDSRVAEGLMRDLSGNVVCGTMSNLFMVKQEQLVTPDLSMGGIAGITRERILEIASALGVKSEIRAVTQHEIAAADELFVCNSIHGIWQVRFLDGHTWPAGTLCKTFQSQLAQTD